MHFFDKLCGNCLTIGMMFSHAFAALLYASIFVLLLYTLGQSAMFLLR